MIRIGLSSDEFHGYYQPYIDKTAHRDIVLGLEHNLKSVVIFYNEIPPLKQDYAYETNKWTIKDILLHIIDTERIFTYRALRIARGDQTELTGFNQDEFVSSGKAIERSFESLIEEYKAVRQASITLFRSFDPEDLKRIGKASGSTISVRAIGYILTGHENHHLNIIKKRYL